MLREESARQLHRSLEDVSVELSLNDPWNFYRTLQLVVHECRMTMRADQMGMGLQSSLAIALLRAYARIARHSRAVGDWTTTVSQASFDPLVQELRATDAPDANEESVGARLRLTFDRSRTEGVFAAAVVVVEGASEELSLPVYSAHLGYDLLRLSGAPEETEPQTAIGDHHAVWREDFERQLCSRLPITPILKPLCQGANALKRRFAGVEPAAVQREDRREDLGQAGPGGARRDRANGRVRREANLRRATRDRPGRTAGVLDLRWGGNRAAAVWIAVRKNLRSVVEHVTVADVARGQLPKAIDRLAEDPDAWITRQPRRESPPSTLNRKVA